MVSQQQLEKLLFAFFSSALIISVSSGVNNNTLSTICSQTQNEEICLQILESDSRTISATLPELSLISINLTMKQANNNYRAFTELRDKATDASVKSFYNKCLVLYKLMIQKINEAYDLSRKGRYKDIHQLGEAQDLAYSCENRVPYNSSTAALSEDMIFNCEVSASVNLYIS